MSIRRSPRNNGSDLRSKSSVPAPATLLSPSELAQLAANFQVSLRTTSYSQVVMADGQGSSAGTNPTGPVVQQLPMGGIPKSFNHGHMVNLVTTVNNLVAGLGHVQGQLTQVSQAVSQASQLYSTLDTRIASDRSAADDCFAEMEASNNELRSGMKQILGVLSATTGPMDSAGVQAALVDDEATAASIKQFGAEWALTVHSQWPDQWVEQAQLLKLWSDHKNGKPSANKKRTPSSSSSVPSLAAASVKAKQPKRNVCAWKIKDGHFICGKTGSLARPLPQFLLDHVSSGQQLAPVALMAGI